MRGRWTIVVMLLVAGASVDGQTSVSPLVLLASIGDYPGETYTSGPLAPAEFVFFEGEQVAVDVSIANWSGRSASLLLPPSPEPPVRAVIEREGQTTAPGMLLDVTWRDLVGGSKRVAAMPTMAIEPGDAVRWRLMFTAEGLAPGFYTVRAETGAMSASSEPVRRRRAEFVVEIRPRSDAMPAELSRRVAEWLTARGDGARARAATAALERVYPDSVAVHLIRSRLAEADGDDALARRELDVAAEFMRQDRDVLFRRFARPGQIEDLVDSLAH